MAIINIDRPVIRRLNLRTCNEKQRIEVWNDKIKIESMTMVSGLNLLEALDVSHFILLRNRAAGSFTIIFFFPFNSLL